MSTTEPTRGERLADWLDRLGLADQLAPAGLPSFTRDAGGGVRWTDPGTGSPLTGEQIADLDELLHSEDVRAFIEETYSGAIIPAF